MQPVDPYRFDSASPQTWNAGRPVGGTNALPQVVIAGMILDLVFCCLRMLAVIAGIVGLIVLMGQNKGDGNMVLVSGVLEVLSGLIMIVFGIAGDSLVLAKKRMGIPFCWVAVGGTILSVVVGVTQLFMIREFNPNIPEGPAMIGAMVGGGFAVLVRLGLLGFYIFCVVTATKTFRDRDASLG